MTFADLMKLEGPKKDEVINGLSRADKIKVKEYELQTANQTEKKIDEDIQTANQRAENSTFDIETMVKMNELLGTALVDGKQVDMKFVDISKLSLDQQKKAIELTRGFINQSTLIKYIRTIRTLENNKILQELDKESERLFATAGYDKTNPLTTAKYTDAVAAVFEKQPCNIAKKLCDMSINALTLFGKEIGDLGAKYKALDWSNEHVDNLALLVANQEGNLYAKKRETANQEFIQKAYIYVENVEKNEKLLKNPRTLKYL